MNSKLFGGILLVVGTTIGAGMLALPVATAQLGFVGSLVLLFVSWLIMTACAFLFLEVNLWLPKNSNLISMAGATLGKFGQTITWMVYLFLLYSILSAYIAGGGDLFHYVLSTHGIHISTALASILFTLTFGLVVFFGIRAVDYVNRGLMFGKFITYALLVALIFPFVTMSHLQGGEFKYIVSPNSITITAIAFGSLLIIPSLRTYFGEDIKSLRKAILIGTIIPLICYIAWDMVIMGVVPLNGTSGLKHMLHSSSSNSDLVMSVTTLVHKDVVTVLMKFFTSVCMATSFLSVSLSLSDFLADGFNVAKKGMGNLIVFGATFLPSLFIVIFYPDAFIRSLNYAGISCIILMVFLPPLMAWRGRYHHGLAFEGFENYQVRGGKFLLALLVVFATLMVGFGLEGAV